MTRTDKIMLALAETGSLVIHPLDEIRFDELRAAAKEDGVQLRWRDRLSDGAVIVTLRKVGRGH